MEGFPNFRLLPNERGVHEVRAKESKGFILKNYKIYVVVITTLRVLSFVKKDATIALGSDSEKRTEIFIDDIFNVNYSHSKILSRYLFFFGGIVLTIGSLFLLISVNSPIFLLGIIIGLILIFNSFEKTFIININSLGAIAKDRENPTVKNQATQSFFVKFFMIVVLLMFVFPMFLSILFPYEFGGEIGPTFLFVDFFDIFFELFFPIMILATLGALFSSDSISNALNSLGNSTSKDGLVLTIGKNAKKDEIEPIPQIIKELKLDLEKKYSPISDYSRSYNDFDPKPAKSLDYDDRPVK